MAHGKSSSTEDLLVQRRSDPLLTSAVADAVDNSGRYRHWQANDGSEPADPASPQVLDLG